MTFPGLRNRSYHSSRVVYQKARSISRSSSPRFRRSRSDISLRLRRGFTKRKRENSVQVNLTLFSLSRFAERTRFELVIRLPVCRFSKPVDSATLPPLLRPFWLMDYKYTTFFIITIPLATILSFAFGLPMP